MTDIGDVLGTIVDTAMSKLKDDLYHQVTNEVRAAVALHSDQLMSNVSVIPAIKSTNEDCLTNITSNGQYLGEVVDTINHTSQNINKKLDSMSTAINLDLETFTQMKNSLSSNTMLLTEVLKVPFLSSFYRLSISFYITPSDFLPFRSFQASGFHPPH